MYHHHHTVGRFVIFINLRRLMYNTQLVVLQDATCIQGFNVKMISTSTKNKNNSGESNFERIKINKRMKTEGFRKFVKLKGCENSISDFKKSTMDSSPLISCVSDIISP